MCLYVDMKVFVCVCGCSVPAHICRCVGVGVEMFEYRCDDTCL